MFLGFVLQSQILIRIRGKDRWYTPDPNRLGDLEKLREIV
jgi:hypothetical protein